MKENKGIYKRKDGRFEARYCKGYDKNGKVVYGSVYGNTKEEAIKKRINLIGNNDVNINNKNSMNFIPRLNLLILGAGAHGKDVKVLAESLHVFDKIKFLDDKVVNDDVIGLCKEAIKFKNDYICAFVAIGNAKIRKKYIRLLKECNFIIPRLISPEALISPNAKIGEGVAILSKATVNDAVIGDYCILASNSLVNSNAKLGDYSHIDCGSIIPRNVIVPNETWLDIGKIYKKRVK